MISVRYAIDRFEGNVAVCNDISTGKNIEIDKNSIPKEAKEGDIIEKSENSFILNKKLTENRYKHISERMDKLFKNC